MRRAALLAGIGLSIAALATAAIVASRIEGTRVLVEAMRTASKRPE